MATGARLLYRDANGGEASVDLPAEGVFLGRGTDCAVRTDDAMVSRKNCRISLQAGRWMAEDLGSSNGTFVNGVRVQKQVLTHADVVRCGTLQVRFVENAAPPARAGLPDVDARVDPAALLAERDQKLRDSNDARDRLRGEVETLDEKLRAAERRVVEAEQDRANALIDVTTQMRASDALRLELEKARERSHALETKLHDAEAELKAMQAELRARAEMDVAQLAGSTTPMPVVDMRLTMPIGVIEAPRPTSPIALLDNLSPSLGGQTKPFHAVEPPPPPAQELPAATVPDMRAVSAVDAAAVQLEQLIAELRASLSVARSLVAEPGVVVPATARAVVVALETAQKRADEAQEKLKSVRSS